jgi:hypothetical protein
MTMAMMTMMIERMRLAIANGSLMVAQVRHCLMVMIALLVAVVDESNSCYHYCYYCRQCWMAITIGSTLMMRMHEMMAVTLETNVLKPGLEDETLFVMDVPCLLYSHQHHEGLLMMKNHCNSSLLGYAFELMLVILQTMMLLTMVLVMLHYVLVTMPSHTNHK